ncbi:MAG: nuclear transport factor 2 family protein, partial [Anaerolineae bacterium]|nr:nuclear transport factor 2 family protein [Anaerolineae bacterium]
HNRIDASFRFQDGKIIQHRDSFSFWRWSSMALGPVGMLLGWSPLVKNKVRRQAAHNLERFIQKSAA